MVGLVISAFVVVAGVTSQNNVNNTINGLNAQIDSIITNQEIPLNQTADRMGANWIKLYPAAGAPSFDGFGSQTNLGFQVNETLRNQLNNLQSQISSIQSKIANAQSNLGSNLVIAGIIGFGIVGLCCLAGYAIHKHTVALINKDR